jgi:16S rRNA (cytidine1402-2'-O)-methyltransferase
VKKQNLSSTPKSHTQPTTLYVVATPIGHLKDMTYRAVETLQRVAFIWCEDTRVTRTLLQAYEIQTPVVSYHDHTTQEELRTRLTQAAGQTIALVSDAGTPLLQDPGYELIQYAIQHGIVVESIPGPSSVINALVVSGLAPYPFTFAGFIPVKATQRSTFLQTYLMLPHTLIFFETPKRIQATLQALLRLGVNRQVVIAREMTKQFETIYRGTVEELLALEIKEKGEIVMLIGPSSSTEQDPVAQVASMVAQGMKPVDAVKTVAKWTGATKSELYDAYINRSK